MSVTSTAAPPAALDPFLSQKLRFWSLAAMLCLVYVHAFNLHPRYLEPWTQVVEAPTPGTALQYFLANGLLRFRIPILFAISGYLLARRDGTEPHGQRVRRRLRTLGLPYLLWSLLWLAALWALEQFAVTRTAIIDAEISPFWPRQLLSQYTPGEVLLRGLLIPAPFQLWFLRSLLVYNLAYPWLRKAVLRWPAVYFSIAGLMWLLLLALPPLLEGEGLLFFGLGVWLAYHQHDVQAPPRWCRPGWLAVLWLGSAALKTWLAFRGAPGSGLGLQLAMLALHKLGEASGMLTAWFGLDALVRRAMARRWFRWLTGFSFMIYVLHVPFVNYATELALRYGRGLPHLHLLTYGLVPLLVVVVSVVVGAALRRAAPRAYGVLTGGRGLAGA